MKLESVLKPTTTEVVYRWPDGHEEVRYSRPYGSKSAADMVDEVRQLRESIGDECPYSVRHV